MIVIAHDLPAMNLQRQFGVSTKKDKKVTERLSSGFRINRAADDAAGLTISEKMRAQIRGLNQGTENAQDGISWVQIGDGALNEVHDMLHRMTELSLQSLNDTYTDDDRAAMEAEFNQLQSQIDTIAQSTQFNTKPIFSDHEPTYYTVEGNLTWPHDQEHNVYSPNNTLVINYRTTPDDPPASVVLTVPEGTYTTQELADEIEDAVSKSPLAYDPRFNFEYTQKGTFNANLEGGSRIESVDGGLSSLLNSTYTGGSSGSLIGTTIFTSDYVRLPITAGKNDSMTFTVEDFSGNRTTKSITLSPGSYTRDELIEVLNNKLSGTNVKATRYGTGIMLAGDDCIISKFKGNMFQIDGAAYTSVFYDNVYHGEVSLTPGKFTGAAVLPVSTYNNGRDEEHYSFDIKSGENDKLTFAPNGSDTPVTITIPQGRYRIGEMVSTLNSLFAANGLDLTATTNQSGSFNGITITTRLKGATSDVGLSETSSAFNTLFTDRKYNVYGTQASVVNETRENNTSSFTGGKMFNDTYYDNRPLKIEAGVNDSFNLKLDGNTYTITLDPATYSETSAIVSAINTKLQSSSLGPYAGKITASANTNGQISLTADISAGIVSLSAASVTGNNGYNDLFRTSYKITETVISGSNARLERTFPDPCSISESEKNIVVESYDGSLSYTITLPVGDGITHDDIKNAVETAHGNSRFTDITYSPYRVDGHDYNFSRSGTGTTTPSSTVYSDVGITEGAAVEGQVGIVYTRNDPATVTIPLKSSFVSETGADQIQLTLNGKTEIFTFDHKTYTPASFAADLQQKINASSFGGYYGGATVEASGNGIKITSRLTDSNGVVQPASSTSIVCRSSNSSLLRKVNETTTAASVTTSENALIPSSGINIAQGDTFEFTLNGSPVSVGLSALSNGTMSSFTSMLNSRFAAEGIRVTASAVPYNGKYQLRLTTQDSGEGNTIAYDSRTGGTVSDKLYGDLRSSGSVTAQTPIKSDIVVENEKNVFRYSVDGVSKEVLLTPGSYTRQELVDMLNDKLEGVSAAVDAGGYLTLTSNKIGNGSSVAMSYDSRSDSAMRAIWGQNEIKAPELNADFDRTDHLILTSKDGTRFRIRSSGTALVNPTITSSNRNPSSVSGYYSTKHATMDGGDLNISAASPLKIDEWNDTLKFNYFRGTSAQAVSIDVAHGEYTTYDQLRTELQSKLDGALGSGEVTVSVDSHGVVIKAVEAGYSRAFGTTYYNGRYTTPAVYGDFYDKVMNVTSENTARLGTTSTKGSNVAGTDKIPYVIGRRNVKDEPVKIKADINDTLSLDFKYTDENGVVRDRTFTMKLDAGTFQGDSLTSMIQEKLNEQLKAAGLAENLIEVGIGGTNAHVAGVDNTKVLTFKLSNSLPLPSSGEYVIDGLGGNAAFSVFYQTTGELVPAYVEGVRDITGGAVIEDEHNTLSFTVDGNSYTLEIPAGEYTGDELINTMNSLLAAQNAPVKAEQTEEGKLKLTHKQMGNHPITNLSGPARGSLFFNEYGGEDEEDSILIQFSSVLDDNKTIDRPQMNTSFLGINSITISKTKYAQKAVGRIQDALDKVSEVRSYFGASQNAIEHVVNRNNITSENTQAAESRLRDTDMAKTMLEHSKNQILIQAGSALLSQAKQDRQNVLQLLQ